MNNSRLTYRKKNTYSIFHLSEDKTIQGKFYSRVIGCTNVSNYYNIYQYYDKVSSIEFWKKYNLNQESHPWASEFGGYCFIDNHIKTFTSEV